MDTNIQKEIVGSGYINPDEDMLINRATPHMHRVFRIRDK
jgi:hypothetical protein